jgi:hypothetical protein
MKRKRKIKREKKKKQLKFFLDKILSKNRERLYKNKPKELSK